ncbi:MAG: alpha/beta hydrolase [Xanthobacteraceae bacterium]|nr:alpha/beta hydrolase [Xanthobacteraceae bacterium]
MKHAVVVALSLLIVAVAVYLGGSKWMIRHETMTFFDQTRDRPVQVDIAIRRDKAMQAQAGVVRLPVAVLNHGNTVKFTEYSFLANLFAMRGYMAVSIQHDLPSDPPLVTKVGEPYVGRLPVYERGVQNILFAIGKLKALYPNADYDHLTMVGHSNGGDIAVYFAKMHPDQVSKVVTLDNLRVPFMTDGKFKILSFRSHDPVFKTDPGVIPDGEICDQAGITVINTGAQHTEMSDRGPDSVKQNIEDMLDKYLNDDSVLAPVDTRKPRIGNPGPDARRAPPGPVAQAAAPAAAPSH